MPVKPPSGAQAGRCESEGESESEGKGEGEGGRRA